MVTINSGYSGTLPAKSRKSFSAILTFLIVLSFYLILVMVRVPEPQYKTEVYEEIDWVRFKPKPQKAFQPADVSSVDKPEELKPASRDEVERIELRTVIRELGLSFFERPENRTTGVLSAKGGLSEEPAKIEIKESLKSLALNVYRGSTKDKLQLPSAGGDKEEIDKGMLTIRTGTDLKLGKIDYGGEKELEGRPSEKTLEGDEGVKISLKALEDFGSDYENLSETYIPLIEWMKKHPVELPEVVKRFMEYKAKDLTSKVTFRVQDRVFVMYLLCKEAITELRICLIEGTNSTLLIDKGLKERSNYLRVGTVNRTETRDILSFGTEQRAPTEEKTREFYQIFLSWWDAVKES